MANKSVLIGGRTVNVKGRSSFDKSFLNGLTSGVGTITPVLKKLVIPSNGRVTMSAHAELPPLATDAYLRSHLKVEAFYTPGRLLSGSWQSWFSGEQVYDHANAQFGRAALPFAFIPCEYTTTEGSGTTLQYSAADEPNTPFGPTSLTDYFNVKFDFTSQGDTKIPYWDSIRVAEDADWHGVKVNLFPYLNYHLLYHHFYRNKSVQRPVFCPTDVVTDGDASVLHAYNLPYVHTLEKTPIVLAGDTLKFGQSEDTFVDISGADGSSPHFCSDMLLDGVELFQTRQRNYGDDYFTAARPQAQAGNPVTVQVDAHGKFSIASLRLQNALQEFEEVNNYATPDYVQVNMARYGVSVANGVVQKPVVLGSADYPLFTRAVELNAQTSDASARNPFARAGMLGSTAGRATANGIDFTFDFEAKEVGYIMVFVTLVPEANYATGIDHDMRIFIEDGDLVDVPCSLLEHVGDEPIMATELYANASKSDVFGYVQRFLWHKAGSGNQIHGLYRKGQSLEAFVPQRNFVSSPQISSSFLEIPITALDDIASVSAGVSGFGVQLDCAFNIHISEPLSESALPALSDPAREHGREVYLSNGGSKF